MNQNQGTVGEFIALAAFMLLLVIIKHVPPMNLLAKKVIQIIGIVIIDHCGSRPSSPVEASIRQIAQDALPDMFKLHMKPNL